MEKRKRKGFTLVELLVTIVIVSLITVITLVSVNKVMDVTKENKNKISLKNIQTSARTYVEEFKREDKFWSVNSAADETEYACASVGMLINKGFLKKNILNTTLDGKTITRNTSVLIKRNRHTKVLSNEELIFNSKNCTETNEIDIDFIVSGDPGENDWYIGDVTVELRIVNEGQIQKDETKYTLTEDGASSNNFTVTGYKTEINEEGKNIDFCVTVVSLKDEEKTFCISDDSEKIFIDKTKPTISDNNFKFDESYNLIANNATDNVTSSENIKYYLTYDNEQETTGSAMITINNDVRTEDKEVKVYVKDEAGNTSNTITKTLNIIDSQTESITSDTKYYCSLDTTVAYDTESEATANCDKSEIGTVSSKTVYKCSLKSGVEYATQNEAAANCSTITTGTVSSDTFYYCSLNSTKYTSRTTAANNCTEQGDTTTVYSCDSGTLSGSKCYEESSATKKTMYGLTCAASSTTTYGWNSGTTTDNLLSCTSKSASCTSSSHVGNTKVSCAYSYDYSGAWRDENNCIELVDDGCSCVYLSNAWRGKCKKYTKTTYTCKASTTTSSTKTYTGTSGSGSTSGGCPSGTTATLNDSESTCSNYIGDTCSSSCSSCCGDYKYYTCTSSYNADKEYYCEEDGETYSSKSSCEKTGSVTSDIEYYCSLDSETYSSKTSATNACNKTTTGTVSNTTNYYCSLDTNTYTSQTTANNNCNKINIGTINNKTIYTCPLSNTSNENEQKQKNNCTNYCEIGTYYSGKNACYSLN